MLVTKEITRVREQRWADPTLTWGLVPTMGALHEGHLSLVRRARQENERVAVTIFVNPTQFAPTEDLSKYPRPLENDLALLEKAGVDLVFTPFDEIMYPPGFQTRILVDVVTRPLEGNSRPTHFAGVTLIVAKLFNIIQPHRAYFGQKDAQQTVVLKQMVRDLNFNLDLIVCPIIRDERGLALSSRNVFLSPEEYESALALNRALFKAAGMVRAGVREADRLRQTITDLVEVERPARIDYVSVADLATLAEVDQISGPTLISLAVFIGSTRLIDNLMLDQNGEEVLG